MINLKKKRMTWVIICIYNFCYTACLKSGAPKKKKKELEMTPLDGIYEQTISLMSEWLWITTNVAQWCYRHILNSWREIRRRWTFQLARLCLWNFCQPSIVVLVCGNCRLFVHVPFGGTLYVLFCIRVKWDAILFTSFVPNNQNKRV